MHVEATVQREGDPAWATRRSQEAGAVTVLTGVCSLSRLHRVLTVRFTKVQNVQVRTEVQNRTVATLVLAKMQDRHVCNSVSSRITEWIDLEEYGTQAANETSGVP